MAEIHRYTYHVATHETTKSGLKEITNGKAKKKRKRDIEKNYPVNQFVKKLRRLADRNPPTLTVL